MGELKKILESYTKIRFNDCDPFNHLNNSKYIDYILNERIDQVSAFYDFDIDRIARESKLAWVSAQTQISYLSPAFPMEEVCIQTQLICFTDKSLSLEAKMWDNKKMHLKAVMWFKLVHFNLSTQKSHQHSDELMKFFNQIVSPLIPQVGFEERVKLLIG